MTRRWVCLVDKAFVPATTGSRVRMLRLTEAIARRWPTSLIVCQPIANSERDAMESMGVFEAVTVLDRRASSLSDVARWPAGRQSLRSIRALATADDIVKSIEALEPDAIWASGAWVAELMRRVTVPWVVDLQHAERAARRGTIRRAVASGNPSLIAATALDRWPKVRAEAAAVASARLVTAPSTAELRRGPLDSAVVPNGADWQPCRPAPEGNRVLFVGSLHYPPNRDAFEYLRTISPGLARTAGIEFDVVGALPKTIDSADGLTLHGEVESVRPFYERAAVCAVPLRFGSGTKTKTIEAALNGVPIVSTPEGVAGLTFPDDAVRVAPLGPAFAQALVESTTDRALAESRAKQAHSFATSNYAWPRIQDEFVRILEQVR